LVFTGANSYLTYNVGGTPFTFTLPSGTSLTRSGAGSTYVYDNVANAGTVTVSGGLLQFQSGTTLTNTGTTTVTGAGSTLYLIGLANSGSLGVDTGGLIQLAGTFTSANLGTLTIASGGTVQLTGTITNTSLAAPSGGSYALDGGTINGGTIAAGALTFNASGGYLSNTSLLDNLNLPSSAYVRFTNGSTFTGATATLGNNASVYWQEVGTLSGKTISLGNGSSFYINGANNALTLGSTTSVTGSTNLYTDGSAGAAFTNQGSITQNNSSYSGQIYASNFTNSGSISATAGTLYLGNTSSGYNSTNASGGTILSTGASTTVYIRGNFTNAGTLLAQNSGLLLFDGTNTTGNFGAVQLSGGGRALLNGTFTNTNLPAPTGGSFELYGGTIQGGTVAAGALGFTTSGGYLDNVSILDNLNVGASDYARFINGTNFTGATATLGTSASVYWQQVGTLSGKTISLGNGSSFYINGANSALTLDSTTSATGTANFYTDGSAGAAFTNQGSITQNNASYSGQIYASMFTNSGSISATAGTLYLGNTSSGYNSANSGGGTILSTGSGTTVYIRGNFTNSGTLLAQNSGLLLFDGTNSSGNLGTVQLSGGGRALLNGTLTNTNLPAPSGGTFELYGGTIQGGTVAAGALSFTSSGGYLDNVSILDNLNVGASDYARLINGTNFTGATATLGTSASVYWQQVGTLFGKTISLGNGASFYITGANSSLTLDPKATATGDANFYTDGSAGAAFVNQGSITQTNASYSGQIYASTFTNSGSITATAGTLYLGNTSSGYNSTNSSGGTILSTGSGTTVYIRGNFTNSGTLLAQSSGLLLFDGTNTTGNLGTVQLSGGGRALLNGTLTNANLAAPTGGTFELDGGTIQGGTVAAGALSFTNSGGYLDDVSILDNLNLGSSTYVRFINGTGFTGATATLGGSATLYWQQVGTLSGKSLSMGNGAAFYITGANNSLTLDPTTSASGSVNFYTDGSTGATFINQGSITQNNASYSGQIYASNVTNSGSITATAGSLFLGSTSSAYSFTNALGGNITVNGASANVQLEGAASNPFSNLGGIQVQNGTLSFQAAVVNSGNITVASGAHFSSSSSSSFTQTAGTLKVDGSFSTPSSGLAIQGGTLTGAGSITGNTTFTGGTLAPGSSVGTLTFVGNLTLTGGATTIMELGGTLNDRVVVSGSGNTLNFGGTLDIVTVSTAFVSGETWNLFGFTSHSGSFATINLPNLTNGWVWDTSQLNTTGVLTLTTFIPVPEPSTYVLLAAGVGAMAVLGRRRKISNR